MKKGICIGINYAETDYELGGCINDADDWAALLRNHKIQAAVLKEQSATRQNIIDGMVEVVNSLTAGETGFITYSGHGTWLPDRSGDEPDRRDEALCPIDMTDDGVNLIVDDELDSLFGKLHPEACLVFITDCCHSGSVFRFMAPATSDARVQRVRFLPPSHFIKSADLNSKMERAFGQGRKASNAPKKGVIHFSGCGDTEYSNDAVIRGRNCGAFTYFAVRAFAQAHKLDLSYNNAHKLIRQHLPTIEFQQTPRFNAPPDLKDKIMFS